ncbi:hypothetical protein ABZ397_08480 [Streptomyces sp. NPDC005876]|uniref:hypothetical protein n=1 Tax=Streptomyces sp. NPDC005876 TaxID=3157076 RepID=UPI0033DF6FEB
MLALRLSRRLHLAVQLRRLLVSAASAGTAFLLLCSLGHALNHQDAPAASALRLAWCAAPLAATVYLAVAVARADPVTRPRPGLSAIGIGPGRLMAMSAITTALACALGSLLALAVFLHLRGDLTGLPFDGAAADSLAAGLPLPYPAVLTLLALVPAVAAAAVAFSRRPRESRPAPAEGTGRRYGRFGAYGLARRETFGAYGRFGARRAPGRAADGTKAPGTPAPAPDDGTPGGPATGTGDGAADVTAGGVLPARVHPADSATTDPTTTTDPAATAPAATTDPAATAPATTTGGTLTAPARPADPSPAPESAPAPRHGTTVLPWGVALLAVGLAVEAMVGGTRGTGAGVLGGWALTALGLALAGPGLTHLCGRLLQAVRPGALRLLAGRVLMEEAHRIGRPLGVVCAVASAAYAAAVLYTPGGSSFGPLRALGALVVGGCSVATLLTAAVEVKHARADTTGALLRLGAPAGLLRAAAALRAAALLALFAPLTLAVAELAALPLNHA